VPIDKALRSDVKMLGNQLGEVIKAEREDVFLAVEKLRKLGREVILLI
jgi:phosphoenolpyruvate carboxylase